MTVGSLCIREVDLAEPTETVQAAAQRMHARNVGTLLVVNEHRQPVGIVTDRDLAIRVVGKGLEPIGTTVRDIMTHAPEAVREDTPIESALSRMRSAVCRRLPVVDAAGQLVGVVSLDDILDLLCEEFSEIGRLLRKEGPQSLSVQ